MLWTTGPCFVSHKKYEFEAPHDKTNNTAWALSKESDQPGHPLSLIRVFAFRMKKTWVLSYPLSAQWRLWSDWAHSQFVGFVVLRLVCYNNESRIKLRAKCSHTSNYLKPPWSWSGRRFEPEHDKTNKMTCASSDESDKPEHPPSLIRVFADRMKKAWVRSYPLSAQRRFWSVWADAQTDLSLCWEHRWFCWFCRAVAHFIQLRHNGSTKWQMSHSMTKSIKWHVPSEDSDQTGRMPRLTWVFAGGTGYIVGFVMMRLRCTQHRHASDWVATRLISLQWVQRMNQRFFIWKAKIRCSEWSESWLSTHDSLYVLLSRGSTNVVSWAASWQNQQIDCVPSDDSAQPGHPLCTQMSS